jgi:predicted nucleotidyltransferase
MAFSVEERESARRRVLSRAEADPRIVAAAVVGAEAAGRVDRWSDLDLTFGVAEGTAVDEVLDEWTRELGAQLDAVHLFDVHVGPTVYRVFLLPGILQLDLSFTPAARFGVERGKLRQAEHYVRLAAELVDDAEPSLPEPPTRSALLQAVEETLALLLRDPGEARDLAERLEPQLRELARPTLDAG